MRGDSNARINPDETAAIVGEGGRVYSHVTGPFAKQEMERQAKIFEKAGKVTVVSGEEGKRALEAFKRNRKLG